jgi:hypothetical protein
MICKKLCWAVRLQNIAKFGVVKQAWELTHAFEDQSVLTFLKLLILTSFSYYYSSGLNHIWLVFSFVLRNPSEKTNIWHNKKEASHIIVNWQKRKIVK